MDTVTVSYMAGYMPGGNPIQDLAGNDAANLTPVTNTTLPAPDTTITSGPAGGSLTNLTSATLTFSSELGATFECDLDGVGFSSCTSPQNLSALGDGLHSFGVQATDTAGNVDASPASRSWTVDTAAPAVVGRSPAPGATGVTVSTTVTVTFDEDMDSSTLDVTSFTLETTGLALVPATVGYDGP